MSDLPSVRGKQVQRALEKDGFRLLRSKGELIYRKEGHVPEIIRVPNHPSKQVKFGTLRAILKAAKWTPDRFKELL